MPTYKGEQDCLHSRVGAFHIKSHQWHCTFIALKTPWQIDLTVRSQIPGMVGQDSVLQNIFRKWGFSEIDAFATDQNKNLTAFVPEEVQA